MTFFFFFPLSLFLGCNKNNRTIQGWQRGQNIAPQGSNLLLSHYQTIQSMPIIIFQVLVTTLHDTMYILFSDL